ncbi:MULTISPECIES: pyridoxamine 5'-phosphate oxidase family protein [unclassified Lysinibacillus]|uniref:pyridoxamine 5'-phosphate oxidase family protein n=1 Tax=unclassified Lysinibacillus TaxID=2636778 RepID=UPI002011B09E|nr:MULTISPECIES: pyridoxamine 5'-phosphate oxidase family protein [unclassified Lysinibacillus]MCL1696700.1 pyridoxamine 5'-phosphate oxidase family protein [Lysinibacillus sp. BPa_S21]MCL1698819.1 pyridoxamine 5'-phosphate oxidase family protein [Lysinibacillus sp. Bpr_S20]
MNNLQNSVNRLLEQQNTAFVGSIDQEGFPQVKAMLAPRVREGFHTFYFTTNTSSMRVAQFRHEQRASVYFCDQLRFEGVMFKGTMEVLEDPVAKQLIWQDGDTLYYPLGVTDPDYCVLKFTSLSGRYYNNFSSKSFEV